MSSDVRLFASVYLFRLFNAFLCRTFFQPDEFWQSLEVAHRWVYGYGHLTWEWQPENALRSPLVPLVFTPAYQLARWIDPAGHSSLHVGALRLAGQLKRSSGRPDPPAEAHSSRHRRRD
jgi:phosphatidylinositol glycan class B